MTFTLVSSSLADACASYPCPYGGTCYADMYGYPHCFSGICCFITCGESVIFCSHICSLNQQLDSANLFHDNF